MSHVEKLDLRLLYNKTETFLVSVTHLILRVSIVQNKIQQTNETKINHINDNHIKFEVSLNFGWIWPTVRRVRIILLAFEGTEICMYLVSIQICIYTNTTKMTI